MDVSDARKLKALEDENAKLKKLLAEAMLDDAALGHHVFNISKAQRKPKVQPHRLNVSTTLSYWANAIDRKVFMVTDRRGGEHPPGFNDAIHRDCLSVQQCPFDPVGTVTPA
jgi:hypothetical protein